MSSVQEEIGPRIASNTVRDASSGGCTGAELVSRLLAATPPYLYAAPPHHPHHAFFFSEMLRSFVNARARHQRVPAHAEPLHHSRRAKKRALNAKMFAAAAEEPKQEWQPRINSWNLPTVPEKRTLFDEKEKFPDRILPQTNYERPLELTINKHNALNQHHFNLSPKEDNANHLKTATPEPAATKEDKAEQRQLLVDPQNDATNAPSSDIILPPPPPIWYPPLYPPPYGLDPLNFFIDLRVSGHIYDRKNGAAAIPKEIAINVPNQSAERPEHLALDHKLSSLKDGGRTHRHASAFSVPKPRDAKGSPVNLCQPANRFNMKYFDDVDVRNHERRLASERNTQSAHYVMHNLKRIYGDLGSQKLENGDDREASKQEMADDLEASDSRDGEEKKNRRLRPAMDYDEFPKRDSGSDSDDDVIVSGESHVPRD